MNVWCLEEEEIKYLLETVESCLFWVREDSLGWKGFNLAQPPSSIRKPLLKYSMGLCDL